ncbi:MAG: metalloregulator ArsR/SmtB family transcription factor [Bryobacteraceae bacterium]
MDDRQFHQIAKTIADPSRLAALEMIAARGEASCSEIREHLNLTAATISHHVKELADSGLVHLRKEAKFLYLTLNTTVWNDYLATLRSRIGPASK